MSDCWGGSWGECWGNTWGAVDVAAPSGASPRASAAHRRQTETRRILDTNNLVLALALAIYQSGCLDDFPET